MRIKYIFKKLKTMRYKEFFKMINEISKKTHKPRIYLLFDMIYCALAFGSGYMDYFEFEFYLLKNKERKTYLTGGVNNDIIKKYNDKEKMKIFSDKVKFNELFKEYLGREYIDLRNTSLEDFNGFVKKINKIVVKPIDECGGKGIEVIEIDKKTNIDKLYNRLLNDKKYLVEEYIYQHKTISKVYPDSLNTLRILSFLDDSNTCRLMNVILKFGNGGNVDNFSSGGMYTFVNEEGIVFVPAIDEKGNIFDKHPKTNEDIVNLKIPHYDKLYDYISKLSKVVPEVRYIGWDIAITEKGFSVIEGNEFPGVFQVKTSISGIREGAKTKYQKYIDIK